MSKTQNSFYNQKHSHIPLSNIRSIDVKSQVSVDNRQSHNEQVFGKILMMAIELERKDIIVAQLNQIQQQKEKMFENLQRNYQILVSVKDNYHLQIDALKNTIATLQEQKIKSSLNSNQQATQIVRQAQEKVIYYENKCKKLQEEKIGIQQQLQKLQVENSMMSFDLAKSKGMQKCKMRDLENQAEQQRNKYQSQKQSHEKTKISLQKYKLELKTIEQRQKQLIKTYETKIQFLTKQASARQNLKHSQVSANEQRIVMLSDELKYWKQEVNQHKKNIQQLRKILADRQKEIQILGNQIRVYSIEKVNLERKNQNLSNKLHEKQANFQQQVKLTQQTVKKLRHSQIQLKKNIEEKQYQLTSKTLQNNRFRRQIKQLTEDLQYQRNQFRKSKLITHSMISQCKRCKLANSIIISKQKKPKQINLNELILEVSKLQTSNSKVERILKDIRPLKRIGSQMTTQYSDIQNCQSVSNIDLNIKERKSDNHSKYSDFA